MDMIGHQAVRPDLDLVSRAIAESVPASSGNLRHKERLLSAVAALRNRPGIISRLEEMNRGPVQGRETGRGGFDDDLDSRGREPLAMNRGPIRGQTQCRPDGQTGMLFPVCS